MLFKMGINYKDRKVNIIPSGDGKKKNLMKPDDHYVALVTENFINNTKCLDEMKHARDINCPMYAIVKEDILLPREFGMMPWKAVFVFTREDQLQAIANMLKTVMEAIDWKDQYSQNKS